MLKLMLFYFKQYIFCLFWFIPHANSFKFIIISSECILIDTCLDICIGKQDKKTEEDTNISQCMQHLMA